LQTAQDILQAVIEATPDAIFVKDLAGRYVLVTTRREVHRQGAGDRHGSRDVVSLGDAARQ